MKLKLLYKLNKKLRSFHGEFVLARSIAKKYHNVKKHTSRYVHDGSCKIVFIVERTEVFSSVQSIVEAAVRKSGCTVYLLPVPRCKFERYDLNTLADNEEFCRKIKGVTVINTYDRESQQFFDLKKINPSYIFLSVPYTEEYPEQYRMQQLSEIAKICYVPYGYSLENEKRYDVISTAFNLLLLQYASYIFLDSPVTYHFCKKRLWMSKLLDGNRLFNVGYPRFDGIEEKNTASYNKILWIPRWTTDEQIENTSSSFFKYKDTILNFAKENPNSNVIIRPHPSAFLNYIRYGKMTENEVAEYKQSIENLPNVMLDNSSSYIPAINEADIMIADFSSIVIEFWARNKPIIYTGPQSEMSQYVQHISDTFYYAKNWNEIEKIISDIQSGNEPQRELRETVVKDFMKEQGHVGEKIINLLLKEGDK